MNEYIWRGIANSFGRSVRSNSRIPKPRVKMAISIRITARGLPKNEILSPNDQPVAVAQLHGTHQAAIIAKSSVAAHQVDEPELPFILGMNYGVLARGLGGIDDHVVFRSATEVAFASQRNAFTLPGIQPRAFGIEEV